MQRNQKTLVVISYYDRRPIHNLLELIRSIIEYPAGEEFDLCIVVNRTKEAELVLPDHYSHIPVTYRHNTGMNIGAWDYGWRVHSGYRDYLFLQDECYVIRARWLAAFRKALEAPNVGLVGESISKLWNRPWCELRRILRNDSLPEHAINGKAVNRVDCYLNYFQENGVDPGMMGTHLRSVVWFLSGSVLEKIGGFLIGRNYGECIAAEIATSKKVEQMSLRITQVEDEEFSFIRHLEYNQDYPGAPYAHEVRYVDYASVRRLLKSKETELWQLLKLKLLKLGRLVRFS
jgi:hypothetical protein